MSAAEQPLPGADGREPHAALFRRLAREVRHELRSQLNQVIGYSDLLIDEATERGLHDLTPDLHKIHLAGLRLLDLINEHVDPVNIQVDNAPQPAPENV